MMGRDRGDLSNGHLASYDMMSKVREDSSEWKTENELRFLWG